MTNNKQQTAVKLYTKNDLIVAIGLTRHGNPNWSIDEIVNDITPIELPSDEEIEKESFDLYANHNTYSLNVRQYKAFKRGAKWMRDKIRIQGGNK
jgi:hypothetical protein